MHFDVERTTVAGRSALTVRGELDIATAPVLAAAIDSHLDGRTHALVIDVTPVRFIDSTGARCLVRGAKQAAAAGVALHVICPHSNSAVRVVIDLLELGQVLPVVESASQLAIARADGEFRP